jgi:hypothetical protein
MWNNTVNGTSKNPVLQATMPATYVNINAATAPARIDVYTDVGVDCTSGAACNTGIGYTSLRRAA